MDNRAIFHRLQVKGEDHYMLSADFPGGCPCETGIAIHSCKCDRSGLYRGLADKQVDEITLIPYGCTKLRIVVFPVVE